MIQFILIVDIFSSNEMLVLLSKEELFFFFLAEKRSAYMTGAYRRCHNICSMLLWHIHFVEVIINYLVRVFRKYE